MPAVATDSMHSVFRILLLLLLPGVACAQTPAALPLGPTAPARSVAVLVDVSGSLKKKFEMTQEAREIILDLVAGRGFKNSHGWICENDEFAERTTDGWTVDPVLRELYSPYWSGGTNLKPLTKPGKVGRLVPFGSLATTIRGRDPWDIVDVEDFESRLRLEYPKRADDFKDSKTCYYLAVARTADFLLERFEEGCYMFVVSDELDDPDTVDVMPTLEAAGIFDMQYIKKKRLRFNELKTRERFHFIARFRKSDRASASTGGQGYVRLSWYAIGEKPQAVPPPPPPPIVVEGQPPPPPPPPPPEPPSFARSLTLLGGLTPALNAADNAKPAESRIKVFDHEQPFLAWQVNGVAAGAVDSPFQITIHRLNETGGMEQVQQFKPAQLARTIEGRLRGLTAGTVTQPLSNGIYRVTIEEQTSGGTGGLAPVAAWIEVKKPWNWMPWLLGISVLGAVSVIGYSVWSLRR